MNINKIATNLKLSKDGFWISKHQDITSYPDKAHQQFLKIEGKSFWFKHRNNCIIEILKKYPPPGILFDIGGGNGYVTSNLQKNGFKTILVEPALEGVRNAQSKGLCPLICSTLEEAGFKKHVIPAFGMFDVLEHIENDINFLKKIKYHLIKNGRLYLTVPAYNILWSVEDNVAGHYRRYTLKEMGEKLSNAGLQIEYISYFFSFLPLPIFFLRTLPSKLGLKKQKPFSVNQKEHLFDFRMTQILINHFLKREILKIRAGKSMPLGSSLFIVVKS